ncbi:MAG: MOSC domain-containing protein [Vulcanimicrobiaceae bacterium]
MNDAATHTPATGRVLSVNVGAVRSVDDRGKPVTTAIYKTPSAGRVAVTGVNLHGDDQADRANHGGPARAAYAYADEDYRWWRETLGRDLPAGTFGENLTLRDIDVTGALIGERWRIGTTLFEVTSPRVPCYKLAMVVGDPTFVKRFAEALRPGAYLKIVEPGDVGAHDPVAIVRRPDHGLTLEKMTHIYFFERERIRELLVPELPQHWRDWVRARDRSESEPSPDHGADV